MTMKIKRIYYIFISRPDYREHLLHSCSLLDFFSLWTALYGIKCDETRHTLINSSCEGANVRGGTNEREFSMI